MWLRLILGLTYQTPSTKSAVRKLVLFTMTFSHREILASSQPENFPILTASRTISSFASLTNTPEVLTDCTADIAMTLLLSATFTFFGTLNRVVYTGSLANCDFLQNLFYVIQHYLSMYIAFLYGLNLNHLDLYYEKFFVSNLDHKNLSKMHLHL